MKKYIFTLSALIIVLVGALAVKAASTDNVTGWAWSSNIGWISFNSADSNTGTNGSGTSPASYGVNVDQNGNFSGHGWSSNVGWISFNQADISGCSDATRATVSTSSGQVNGWVRVMSGVGRTDGWDGCVKLSEGTTGTIFPTKNPGDTEEDITGVMYDNGDFKFKGYAWGSDVLGWVGFSPTLTYTTCTNNCGPTINPWNLTCSGPTSLTLTGENVTATFSANISGSGAPSNPSYSWSNGDGTTVGGTTGSTFVKQYSSADTYDGPSLSVNGKNASCSDVTVSVSSNPPGGTGSCTAPLNSEVCNPGENQTTVTGSTIKLTNPNACPPDDSADVCNFSCKADYTLYFGECVKVDLNES